MISVSEIMEGNSLCNVRLLVGMQVSINFDFLKGVSFEHCAIQHHWNECCRINTRPYLRSIGKSQVLEPCEMPCSVISAQLTHHARPDVLGFWVLFRFVGWWGFFSLASNVQCVIPCWLVLKLSVFPSLRMLVY